MLPASEEGKIKGNSLAQITICWVLPSPLPKVQLLVVKLCRLGHAQSHRRPGRGLIASFAWGRTLVFVVGNRDALCLLKGGSQAMGADRNSCFRKNACLRGQNIYCANLSRPCRSLVLAGLPQHGVKAVTTIRPFHLCLPWLLRPGRNVRNLATNSGSFFETSKGAGSIREGGPQICKRTNMPPKSSRQIFRENNILQTP